MCDITGMRYTPNYHTACKIQYKILAQMEAQNLKPADLCSLTTAWEKLEERKRILRMKPKPRDQDVSLKQKPSRNQTFQE